MRLLPTGNGYYSGDESLLERPQLALQIAIAINSWNRFESDAAFLYGDMMTHRYGPPAPNGGTRGAHPVALQVFETLDAFRPKLDLLRGLLEYTRPDLLDHWNTITRKKIESAQRFRNKLAHSIWGHCADFPEELLRVPTFGHPELWCAEDFAIEIRKIRVASFETTQLKLMVTGKPRMPDELSP